MVIVQTLKGLIEAVHGFVRAYPTAEVLSADNPETRMLGYLCFVPGTDPEISEQVCIHIQTLRMSRPYQDIVPSELAASCTARVKFQKFLLDPPPLLPGPTLWERLLSGDD